MRLTPTTTTAVQRKARELGRRVEHRRVQARCGQLPHQEGTRRVFERRRAKLHAPLVGLREPSPPEARALAAYIPRLRETSPPSASSCLSALDRHERRLRASAGGELMPVVGERMGVVGSVTGVVSWAHLFGSWAHLRRRRALASKAAYTLVVLGLPLMRD